MPAAGESLIKAVIFKEQEREDMLKRIIDLVLSSLGILSLAPLLIIITSLIKFSSPGSIFYLGVRSGQNGVPFKIFKFRTMVVNAEHIGGGTTALNDPRITKIGKYLREYKLDELPQLFNVLRGEMSLVGPRPELLHYTQQYTECERVILSVRPGITDLSSIEFVSLDKLVGSNNADAVYEKKVLKRKNELRIKYVENQSFWLDMKIIFMTIQRIMLKIFKSIEGV